MFHICLKIFPYIEIRSRTIIIDSIVLAPQEESSPYRINIYQSMGCSTWANYHRNIICINHYFCIPFIHRIVL